MIDRSERCIRGGRRQAILEVARDLFSKEGYAATSMSHIAAQLGGSKGTLYNYFRSKEELFEAHIEERCNHFAETIFIPVEEEKNSTELLKGLAKRTLTLLLADESLDFYRLVIAEAKRNSNIGRAMYESGPSTGIKRTAHLLERIRDKGDIVTDDCVRAAEEFIGLLHGGMHLRRLLNLIPTPLPDEIEAEAARVTETFLRAYGSRN